MPDIEFTCKHCDRIFNDLDDCEMHEAVCDKKPGWAKPADKPIQAWCTRYFNGDLSLPSIRRNRSGALEEFNRILHGHEMMAKEVIPVTITEGHTEPDE